MNSFIVFRTATGEVIVQAINDTRENARNLTEDEARALDGLLNAAEFEQQIDQTPF